MTTKSEENPALQSFREFVKAQAAKRNLSMRKLSLAIGMTPSYFSEILSGKKRINVDFLNSLADYLQIPRVDVYQAAGWLDLDEEDLLMNRVKEWSAKDPNFRQAIERMMEMDTNQRSRMFVWIFFKTLQETNRLQTPTVSFKWDEAIKIGDISPDALDQLSPDQRQALTGVVQLMLEAFLAKQAKGEGDQLLGNDDTPKSK
jgi:transcriptional regulator with XRE-family HTH domain